jgi:hypothetical protein
MNAAQERRRGKREEDGVEDAEHDTVAETGARVPPATATWPR